MSNLKITIGDVSAAAIALFLETGKDSDLPTIAAKLGASVSTVRKRVNEKHGFVPGCGCWHEGRQSYSKSYRGMEAGAHKVWVYGPDRETLRQLALKPQAQPTAAAGLSQLAWSWIASGEYTLRVHKDGPFWVAALHGVGVDRPFERWQSVHLHDVMRNCNAHCEAGAQARQKLSAP